MRRALMVSAVALSPFLASCEQAAWGEANSIILVSTPELWAEVEDTVKTALEPRIQTVRNELMFMVTHQPPGGEYWANMRRFRQLLMIGPADAEWMQPAMEKLDGVPQAPAIEQVYDVWARDQLVTLLILPAEGDAGAVRQTLPQLAQLFNEQFEEWSVRRMFLSGIDSAGAQRLRAEAGFSVVLPNVYQWRGVDSTYVFRNDNPDPAELIREVTVTWRSPIPEGGVAPAEMLAWRDSLTETIYNYPQEMILESAIQGPIEHQGREGFQIQAMWRNPPEANWPAGGPFILRLIPCAEQDRIYLIDAWLYAPQERKYEYMIQLQTILDSFRCGGGT